MIPFTRKNLLVMQSKVFGYRSEPGRAKSFRILTLPFEKIIQSQIN
jgi:hypothetical protein